MGRTITRALLAACALALAACASGGSDTSAGDSASTPASASPSAPPAASLTIWADPVLVPALEQAGAAHTDATGTPVAIEAKDSASTRNDLSVLAPQGQGPDLFVGDSDWVGDLVDGGMLAPVDLAGQESRFRPISITAFRYAGRDYGIPISTRNLALFRNTELAARAPRTIDEMAKAGLRLQKAGVVDLPIALPVGPTGDAHHWYPFYSASGGYLFGQGPDGTYTTDALGVGEAGGIRAAQDLADLAERGVLDARTTPDDALAAFTAGRAAYLIAGPESVQRARDAGVTFTVEAIPGFASTTRPLSQALVTARGFLLSAFARNAPAAREFLSRTVMTTEVMDQLHAPSGEAPAWSESFTAAAADPVIRAFGDFADTSVPTPNLPGMAPVWAAMSSAEIDVMAGADPARRMRRADAEISAAVQAG